MILDPLWLRYELMILSFFNLLSCFWPLLCLFFNSQLISVGSKNGMTGHREIFHHKSVRLLEAADGFDSEYGAAAVRTWPHWYPWHYPSVWRWNDSMLCALAQICAPNELRYVVLHFFVVQSNSDDWRACAAGLKKLDFSQNQCKHISPFIGLMKDLTDLNLRGNRLKDLPKELGAIGNMKMIDLGENRYPDRCM